MICPNCGSHVPDGSIKCPACRVDLGRTIVIPKIHGHWCSSCGSLIPAGMDACPNCGLPLPGVKARVRQADDGQTASSLMTAQGEALDNGEVTTVMPRIESAIPSEPDQTHLIAEHDEITNMRFLFTAVLAAVVVMGGSVLAITHPWNPTALDTKAKTEADTSWAGFPGFFTHLQGQDNGTKDNEVTSGDDHSLQQLLDYHQQLGELNDKLKKNQELFFAIYLSGDAQAREDGQAQAQELSIDISNLINEISQVNVESGTYVDERDNLLSLGNWLRNQSDALSTAWNKDVNFDNPEDHEEEILSSLQDSSGSSLIEGFSALFQKNYDAWKPQQRDNE